VYRAARALEGAAEGEPVKPGTVFACDAQPIVIEGLERVLGATTDLQFAGWASNPAEALRRIGELRPDLALIDQSQGFRGALQLVSSLRDISLTTQPVLWIGEMADSEALRALQFGARGVVRKTLPTSSLLECLRAVLTGQVWIENGLANHAAGLLARRGAPRLTTREREIVRLICRGMKNRQIAESLRITPGTVKVHLMHVFEKTGVRDRFELAIHGRRMLGPEVEPDAAPVAEGLSDLAESLAR
jgi:two-component system nitrate/nitrite response regulator NarL